ncbi:PREDICTED: butyrophilin subfamily 1 member A1-like [Mesitornis unicolor]|uniref:butyrophilin subfamily 1 member A1-like n=1 Tax=Mesitornis unicolor TaxID=54374 RepID=UPI00052898C1|nr:PREDICTED: butyrophilin subfamily 1 member A1-like [Mesitornis unicolor]
MLLSLAVEVTMDPSTAHPQLLVSPDGASVCWEDAPGDPSEGFGADPCVLGHQGSWALGVAKESLKKRDVTVTAAATAAATTPEAELWSMGLCEGQFWALTSLDRVPLCHLQVPRRVRVSLDYEKGQVAFFDAEKRALLFAFPAASFNGESVHPWFLVWGEGSRLTLCP